MASYAKGKKKELIKTKIEDCSSLDSSLLKELAKNPGQWMTAHWQAPDSEDILTLAFLRAHIDWAMSEFYVDLKSPIRNGVESLIERRIYITPIRCGLGGCRWLWLCPHETDEQVCGRKMGRLHLPEDQDFWACRWCHGLCYKSQGETARWRALRKYVKQQKKNKAYLDKMHRRGMEYQIDKVGDPVLSSKCPLCGK